MLQGILYPILNVSSITLPMNSREKVKAILTGINISLDLLVWCLLIRKITRSWVPGTQKGGLIKCLSFESVSGAAVGEGRKFHSDRK